MGGWTIRASALGVRYALDVPPATDASPCHTPRCRFGWRAVVLALLPATAGCAASPAPAALDWASGPQRFPPPVERPPGLGPRRWEVGEARPTGYLAVTEYNDITLTQSGGGSNLATDDDLSVPTIGGGFQFKLGGNDIDLGLEILLALSGRGKVSAFVFGSGGTAVAVDIDLLICDFYGGPFASLWVTERVRIYGGAGPLVQFAGYDQRGADQSFDDDGSGFGVGWYGRVGVELFTHWGTSIGVGVRFSDSSIELDDHLGDLDAYGTEYAITVTTEW